MLPILQIKIALAAATAALSVAAAPATQVAIGQQLTHAPELVSLQPGKSFYRAAGEFTRDGRPVEAPAATARVDRPLAIMKYQVTAADYQRCVADGACLHASDDRSPDRPAVNVSWRDASAYATWLSRKTGEHYRLPTDTEWAYAAGSRYRDDAVPIDADDPSKRALARYRAETGRSTGTDAEPKPLGHFGVNENGIADMAGNVWEWTDTCYTRTLLDRGSEPATVNCGVRVVEGEHRSYVTDFIRDARAGGCAAGLPPSNLGFRLVREPKPWFRRLLS